MWKKITEHFGFSLLLSFVFSFIFSFFSFSSSYAISPTGIIDSSTINQVICSSDSGIPASYDCSDYNYIRFDVVNFPDPYSSSRYFTFQSNLGSYRNFQVNFTSSSIFDISNFTFIQQSTSSSTMLNGSMRWTLLESLGDSSGSCPICPEVPENPYDQKLDNIVQAIYVCAGVMLVLYFFYCIYRLIIRNSGVK